MDSLNLLSSNINKKKRKIGPKYYKPNRASINKRNAKKIIIQKYQKGYKRFRINKNVTVKDEKVEWEDIDENKLHTHCVNGQNFNAAKGLYRNAQKKLIDNWKEILFRLFNVMIENNALDKDRNCIKCKKPATFRCMDCGSDVYFCSVCEDLFHNNINIFHQRILLDQDSNSNHNRTLKLPQICSENCEHQAFKILVVHLKGQFSVNIPGCKGIVETLIKHKLFPSTPVNPNVAFTFELLDLYAELLLQAHVPYHSFCRVLDALHSSQNINKNIYYLFTSTAHYYLAIKNQIKNTVTSMLKKNYDFNCPACPQPNEKNAKIIVALDGNFQLRRLKCAGNDINDQLVKDQFIIKQKQFDEWMITHDSSRNKSTKNQETACDSYFKAADQARSNIKSKHLDDTGLFGSTCRHGIPLKFINLKGIGERFSLAECLLYQLQDTFNESSQSFVVLYDIACSFHAHINKSESALFQFKSRFDWCISIFHAFAHSMKCQLKYHPRICSSIGLTDGESLERLWSYLGRFALTTKYMRPSHRLDILELAIQNITYSLAKRFHRAKKLSLDSKISLEELNKQHGIDESKILIAIENQKKNIVFKEQLMGKEQYFSYLMDYHKYNIQIEESKLERSKASLIKSKDMCLKKIKECEENLDILEFDRWNPFDPKYSNYLDDYCRRNLDLISDKLRKLRNEYIFNTSQLYNTDHKGHKLASKIKIEVSKISKQIEVQILHYQHLRSNWSSKLADNFPKATFNDIVNHGSNFWKSLDLAVDNDTNIPRIVINHSIQHFNNFKRAEEEINLIPIELNRLYTFWINQKLEIKGIVYILKGYYEKIKKNIKQCQDAFLKINETSVRGESKNLNPSIYISMNEKEEDRLSRENLELENLEIQIEGEDYEGEGYESESEGEEIYEDEDKDINMQ
ncbi:unnamed protein product [Rhizophagus irregularis]|nr:unnamed protein product [Rhizophagus irregularis]